MPNSMVVDEAIHADSHHKDLKRIIAISIDEGSAEYVYDWAINNIINPATDLVRIYITFVCFLNKKTLTLYILYRLSF